MCACSATQLSAPPVLWGLGFFRGTGMNDNSVTSDPSMHKRKFVLLNMRMQKPSGYSLLKTKLSAWLRFDSPLWPVLLLTLVMNLSGCAHPVPAPCACPAIPTRPVLTEPLPSKAYSISAQEWLQKWQSELTGTPRMFKP